MQLTRTSGSTSMHTSLAPIQFNPSSKAIISGDRLRRSSPASSSAMRPDWTSLQTELLELISKYLPSGVDHARFRSVCTAWRAAAPRRPHLPWLYWAGKGPDFDWALHCFPDTEHRYRTPLPGGVFSGCSRGWIVLHNPAGISLYNPFTKLNIRLPDLGQFPGSVQKIVISSNVAAFHDFEIMALCAGRRLFHSRPVDGHWTPLPPVLHDPDCFTDMIFYKGKFYAVCQYRLFVCDLGSHPRVDQILPLDPLFADRQQREIDPDIEFKSYLVVSNGDLLLVAITDPACDCGNSDCEDCEGLKCEVFRVDLVLCCEMLRWELRLVKMKSLGGRSLFLSSESASISVGYSRWCRGNCVYYIKNTARQVEKITVFNIEEGDVSFVNVNCWPYHWITPSLC